MAAAKAAKIALERPNRQTVTLTFNLGGGDEKQKNWPLNLVFVPREVVVRQITWSGTAAPGITTLINTDLVRDRFLGSISGAADGSLAPASSFNLNEQNAAAAFWFTQNGIVTTTTYVGFLVLTLEFRA